MEAEQKPGEITEGDFIQWESQGALQFPEPRQVTSFSDDGDFLFVEGSQTGIPVNEAMKAEAPKPPSFADPRHIRTRQRRPGMQQATMPLSEGDATLEWPRYLSSESFEDFEAWVQLMLRRAKRSIRENDENTGGEPG